MFGVLTDAIALEAGKWIGRGLIVAGTALAGYGIFRIGKRRGWWGSEPVADVAAAAAKKVAGGAAEGVFSAGFDAYDKVEARRVAEAVAAGENN
jgi:hypothetical protein